MGLLDKFFNPNDPNYVKNQGLLGLSSGLLGASGWSPTPISTGQALGQGLQGFQQGAAGAQSQILAQAKENRLQQYQDMLNKIYGAFVPPTGGAQGGDMGKFAARAAAASATGAPPPITSMPPVEGAPGAPQIPLGGTFKMSTRGPEFGFDPAAAQAAEIARRKAEYEGYGITPPTVGTTSVGRPAPSGGRTGLSPKQRQELNFKLEQARPKVEAQLEAKYSQGSLVNDNIDTAINQATGWTTGWMGEKLSNVPGTPAHDLQQTLQTIRSNIGFDKLQEMRANSPSGGALGNVSDNEGARLESVWGSVVQSQSKEQLVKNLKRLKQATKESWDRVYKAYEKDYGKPYQMPKQQAQPTTGNAPPGEITATGPNGQKLVLRNGQWQPM